MNVKLRITTVATLLKNRRVAAGLVVIITAAVIIFLRAGSGAPDIATVEVSRGEFVIDITTKGELKAAVSTTVRVPQNIWGSTRIVRLVEDGALVKEGDFLVQFDTSEFEKRLKDQENTLENVKADYTSQMATIESNRKQMENNLLIQQYSYEQSKLRYQQMQYEAAAKQREMEIDFKKAELSLAQTKEKLDAQKVIDEADIRKSELRVRQAQTNYDRAQEQLGALTLTAPKSGMVVLQETYGQNGREKVKVGSTPYPGMEIVSIPDLTVMQVTTSVNEIDISRVEPSQKALVTLDAVEGPVFYGAVTSVATLARMERGSEAKVFDVVITLNGEDERLKPGMTATCRIVTGAVDSVLSVPLEAVFEKEDTTVVYVKNRGFDMRKVALGKKNNDYIVIEDGLHEGDRVALRDPSSPLQDIGAGGSVGPGSVDAGPGQSGTR